jgi:hypothetical protein
MVVFLLGSVWVSRFGLAPTSSPSRFPATPRQPPREGPPCRSAPTLSTGLVFTGCEISAGASASSGGGERLGSCPYPRQALGGRDRRQADQDRRRPRALHRPGRGEGHQSPARGARAAVVGCRYAARPHGQNRCRCRGAQHQPLLVPRRARRRRRADQDPERGAGRFLRRPSRPLCRLRDRVAAISPTSPRSRSSMR